MYDHPPGKTIGDAYPIAPRGGKVVVVPPQEAHEVGFCDGKAGVHTLESVKSVS